MCAVRAAPRRVSVCVCVRISYAFFGEPPPFAMHTDKKDNNTHALGLIL